MVRYCKKCGAKVDNDMFKFCPKCGEELSSNMVFCNNCGSVIENKDSKFCPKCGKPVGSTVSSPSPTFKNNVNNSNQSGSDNLIIVGVTAVIIAVFILVTLYIISI